MKYTELKDYLKERPFLFQPLKEKQEEFNQRIANSERKPIIFVDTSKKYNSDDIAWLFKKAAAVPWGMVADSWFLCYVILNPTTFFITSGIFLFFHCIKAVDIVCFFVLSLYIWLFRNRNSYYLLKIFNDCFLKSREMTFTAGFPLGIYSKQQLIATTVWFSASFESW